jgi:hypothetical protein
MSSQEASEKPLGSNPSEISVGEVWPDTAFKNLKVLISLVLEEDQWLRTGNWLEWLRSVPALAKIAKIEGLYETDSALIVLSLPVAVWDLLPKYLALSFISFTRSDNKMGANPPKGLSSNINDNYNVTQKSHEQHYSLANLALQQPRFSNYQMQSKLSLNREEQSYMNVVIEQVASWMKIMDLLNWVNTNFVLSR